MMIADPTLRLLLGVSLVCAIGCGDSGLRSSPRTDTAAPGLSAGKPSAGIEAETPPGRRVLIGGIDLGTIGYDKGTPSAPLVVVEFSDFGCPYCGEFARETFPGLDKEFIRTGKVYFKYVPFVIGMFPNTLEAAFVRYAAGAGVDESRFAACYARAKTHPRTSRANEVAARLGVCVTPSFIVNGRPVEGALPLRRFPPASDQSAEAMKAFTLMPWPQARPQ